jgi:pimeloyl-ACP methyl ester carboxylesterase
LLPLAEAGFHAVAPDQRGYGRTTGWNADFDDDVAPFRLLNLVRDALGLVSALGYRRASVVGHDVGSVVAAWCALTRPDVFNSVALMSPPFGGPPALPFDTDATARPAPFSHDIDTDLAALNPSRKYYQRYFATREAESDIMDCPQGLHDFLRAYYHVKSADWAANKPFPLADGSATELAKMPTYYVMDRDQGMAATVAAHMPSEAEITACGWLPDHELRLYSGEFARTGLQGGLQFYRCATSSRFVPEQLFSGAPSTYRRVSSQGRTTGASISRRVQWRRCRGSGVPTCGCVDSSKARGTGSSRSSHMWSARCCCSF